MGWKISQTVLKWSAKTWKVTVDLAFVEEINPNGTLNDRQFRNLTGGCWVMEGWDWWDWVGVGWVGLGCCVS